MNEKAIRAEEREKIAKFLETHHIDWDCSVIVSDKEDYDGTDCDENGKHDEFKARACQRMEMANIIRGKIKINGVKF